MQSTIVRGIRYFSYTPLLGLAAAATFAKLIVYAWLVGVEQFGALGKMFLLSTAFGIGGHLGLQSLASRQLPALLARGRDRQAMVLLARTVTVTTGVGVGCILAAAGGVRLFDLTGAELAFGIAHGWAQSTFLLVTFESRSRLEMMRFARDTALRGGVVALAGCALAALGGGANGIVLAEIVCTLLLLTAVSARAMVRAQARAYWLAKAAIRDLPVLPWRAAFVLLAGSLVGFASFNFDRWFAAQGLGREAFGQYAFAWLVLIAAQSMQALLNSGLLPLLARRRAEGLDASASRLTRIVSTSLLVGGICLSVPAAWVLERAVAVLLPQFADSTVLLLPLLFAAVLRLSDFWSSLLIVVEREGLLLTAQSAAVGVVGLGYIAWLTTTNTGPTQLSLAWLAFAAALLSHAASAAGVLIARRAAKAPAQLTS